MIYSLAMISNFINGTVIDTLNGQETKINLLIENGILKGMGYLPDEDDKGITVIDIRGHVVLPNVVNAQDFVQPTMSDCITLTDLKNCSPIQTKTIQIVTSQDPMPLAQFVEEALTILIGQHKLSIGDVIKMISTNPRKRFHIKQDGIGLSKKPNFIIAKLPTDTTPAKVAYIVQNGEILNINPV